MRTQQSGRGQGASRVGERLLTKSELLAPAGDWDCLRAAVANGADAVYFGLPLFNARLRAENFTEEELGDVMDFLHRFGVKGYVTLNVLVFTHELKQAAEYLLRLHQAGVDAIIVQDLGVAEFARQVVPELPVHASTQMTLSSPEGIAFARSLGVQRAVLARELSLRELEKFAPAGDDLGLPLEVFVHGALCVAYSGQCLTSESLGQRSANRGECAQACRMPYDLIVDGKPKALGDRHYLLSPQDLAAVDEIPELMRLGVVSFKIEGRLKNPEYVAAVCQVYRRHIDAAWDQMQRDDDNTAGEAEPARISEEEQYRLEMVFSRGLYRGWMHGVNHQELVHARYGKKRGAFVGRVIRVGPDFVELDAIGGQLKPGDGIVFESPEDTNAEQGGRVFEIEERRLRFQYGRLAFERIAEGAGVWKTDDPALNRELRRSFAQELKPPRSELFMRVTGAVSSKLTVEAWVLRRGEASDQPPRRVADAAAESKMPLDQARKRPLQTEALEKQLGRLGESPFELQSLCNELSGDVMLPVSELNRLRRELVVVLSDRIAPATMNESTSGRRRALRFETVREALKGQLLQARQIVCKTDQRSAPRLVVLCRTLEQTKVALQHEIAVIYVDFEDIRRYRDAVEMIRHAGTTSRVVLATPRIQKAGERGFFSLIRDYEPDGVLVRNLGALSFFQESGIECVGDFSLNVANPLTGALLLSRELTRLTASYDLNADQVVDLLRGLPTGSVEVTLHQHMPMFHMEHCVFAAFLSDGTDHTNCGRPCDHHDVALRDRVGQVHPLKADVGCRNTLFNGRAQSGAAYWQRFVEAGARDFRVEFLNESAEDAGRTIDAYRALIEGRVTANELVSEIGARSQLGVTLGPLEVKRR